MKEDIIPYRIAPTVIKRGIYQDIILYALAAFGELKSSSFLNNQNEKIRNRLDKDKFKQSVNELEKNKFIILINQDDPVLKITTKGEDFLLERMEEYPSIMEIFKELDKTLY